jgi:sugar phosphate permease
MSGGLVVPALSSMIVRWEPHSERGRLATVVYTGSQASAVGTAVFTGLVTHSHDWRLVFLLLGALPLLWLPPWLLLVSDSPATRRGISREELHLLLAQTDTSEERPRLRDIPFRAILSCPAVWGVVAGNMGVAWAAGHTSLLLPQYLAGELGLPLHHTGLASALPYLGCSLAGLLASLLYSWLTQARGLAPTTARKLCSSLCLWGFSLLCLPLLLLPHHPLLVTVLSTASYSLMGFNLVGAWGTPQDIAPNYVATLMGLIGLASYMVTALVPHTLSLASSLLAPQQVWPSLFTLVAAVTFLANCLFLVLATARLQSWNWAGRRGRGGGMESEGLTQSDNKDTT